MSKTKAAITARQARRIEHYVIDCDTTNTAIRAGFSERTAQQIGHALLGKPIIADAIAAARAKLAKKADLRAELVIAEFSAMAFLDPSAFYGQDGKLLSIHEMPQRARRAITGMDVEQQFRRQGPGAASGRRVAQNPVRSETESVRFP